MGTGYNGLPNIKMEDGISSIGVKVIIFKYYSLTKMKKV